MLAGEGVRGDSGTRRVLKTENVLPPTGFDPLDRPAHKEWLYRHTVCKHVYLRECVLA